MQGSSSISSADLFGRGRDMDDSNLDLSAADLINRISFQVTLANLYLLSLGYLASLLFEPTTVFEANISILTNVNALRKQILSRDALCKLHVPISSFAAIVL